MTVGGLLQTLKLPRLETSGFISVTSSRRGSCPEFQIGSVESFQMNPWIICSRIQLPLAAPAGENGYNNIFYRDEAGMIPPREMDSGKGTSC